MKTRARVAVATGLALAFTIGSAAGVEAKPKASKTTTTVGADASEWSSDTTLDCLGGVFPVGGAGQLNGGFTIAERDGAEIGLRATDRTDGLLAAPSGKKKGEYRAATGFDDAAMTRAEWNYDIHVDLRGTDTTLADYDLTLHQTFASELYGVSGPLTIDPADTAPLCGPAVLLQISWNPVFGNDTFDPTAEGTYNIMLKLSPKDGGKPLMVKIKVRVSD